MRFQNTTQPAIEEMYYVLRRIREASHLSEIVWINGNHDERLNSALKKVNEELVFLRQAQGAVPAISLKNLLRFDELRITSNKEYDDPVWLWPESKNPIKVRHGEEWNNLSARNLSTSQIQGHCHNIVYDNRTLWEPAGPRVVTMMSPGCLVRPDGPIPRFNKQMNWQQGIGIAILPPTGEVHISVHPIHNGTFIYGHKVYNARNPDDVALEVCNATGVKQFVR
jgi:hypothetical protein